MSLSVREKFEVIFSWVVALGLTVAAVWGIVKLLGWAGITF